MKFKYKQVIVVRSDLEMSRGKLAVQVAHASLLGYLEASEEVQRGWLEEGYPKIVLQADSSDFGLIIEKADFNDVRWVVVNDFGLTELEPDTLTCLGLAPAPVELVNKITGNLRLLK